MKNNNAYAPEIDLSVESYISKTQSPLGKMHLKPWPSKTKGRTFYYECKLSSGERSVCDMATN